MKIEGTIGFIGTGNMAEALIRGLLHAGVALKEQILGSDPREERCLEMSERYGVRVIEDNAGVAAQADILVLSVKPQVMARVLEEVALHIHPHALVISIAAGIPLVAIEGKLPQARVIRTMPNTPALVGAGATAIAAGGHATADDIKAARRIFDSVGTTVVLEEAQLDAVTGLSGSGPAYIFLIIEALSDAGVKVGLSRHNAQGLAAQTVLGSAKLLIETNEHPGRLKDMVTSPGGTAIAGLHTLEAGGLRTTLMNAVEEATRRSRELGEMAVAALKGSGPTS
ncbi:MAG TPA: pyrroline-5-carboxylate reductase [Vicinamibacteria bacterium]|nr:pyrroline-5-carboxylate reductase [Vicinamibacteria bacterium]